MAVWGEHGWILSWLLACSICVSHSFTINPSLQRTLINRSRNEPSHGLFAGQGAEPDLFEYFDPLLSPHAYPDGISPATKPDDMEQAKAAANKADALADETEPILAEDMTHREEEGNFANSKSSGKGKIGVLLMDHGSRNKESNARLENLAKLYQLSLDEENIVVEYSHMEIAAPSIKEGLEKLVNQGVGMYILFGWKVLLIKQIISLTVTFFSNQMKSFVTLIS